jgi:hypothetical protein
MVLLFWMLEYKCRGSGTGQARGQPRSVLDPPTSETPLGLPLPPWTATVLNNTPTPPPPRATTRRKRKSGRCKTPERPSTQSAALGRTGDPGPTPRRAPVRRGRENGTAPPARRNRDSIGGRLRGAAPRRRRIGARPQDPVRSPTCFPQGHRVCCARLNARGAARIPEDDAHGLPFKEGREAIHHSAREHGLVHGVPPDGVLRGLPERTDPVKRCGGLALLRQHAGREEDATRHQTFVCKTPYSSAMTLR